MNTDWTEIAEHSVQALGVQRGEHVEIIDHAGRYAVLLEFVLAIERRGATPRVELLPPDLLPRMLSTSPIASLSEWDRHRIEWIKHADRVLALEGYRPDLDVDSEALETWIHATDRIEAVEEQRKLPFMLIAVPTEERANSLGLDLSELEATLLPALRVNGTELEVEIIRTRQMLDTAGTLVVQGNGHQLKLDIQGRNWLQDTGEIPDTDGPRSVQPVVNLPAGSVYTTVQETSAAGSLFLPRVNDAENVVFHFRDGRVDEIQTDSGAESVTRMFDQHSGEPRRISHIGIGLNPRLHRELDWALVDEHQHGSVFIAFGENRYLGGENESSLNIDFVLPSATVIADGRLVVDNGKLLA